MKQEYSNDLIDQEVGIGDYVVYNPPHYKGIVIGTIKERTAKTVTVTEHGSGRAYSRRAAEVLKINNVVDASPEFFI